jgi:DNA-binding response OmpR family regulator
MQGNEQGSEPAFRPGLRVLLVEDEVLIAFDCEALLLGLGVSEVCRVRNVAEGLGALDAGTFDAAVLDVRLGAEDSMPLARRLEELGVPFGFMSGLADDAIPAELKSRPQMPKPFNLEEVRKLLSAVLGTP